MNAAGPPRLVLVVGVGRSGTSLLASILRQLGLHVPQPEVSADETNPRGFSEPRWVVDFHTRLLRQRRVTVNDARPAAWESTGKAAEDEAVRVELRDWLGGQVDRAHEVVVKDPRTGWFLPLWKKVSLDLGVDTSFVTMLRHPAEVLASATKSYGTWQTPASRVAAWINVTLETERLTRGSGRAFVRHEDLLLDWPGQLGRVGRLLELPALSGASHDRNPEISRFVDPSLHRNRAGWEGAGAPGRIRELAEDVWRTAHALADEGADTADLHAALDGARSAYAELYAEAESIAQSSLVAARPRRGSADRAPAAPNGWPSAPPASLRARLARRVPAPYRRRLRRAVRSPKRS